MAGEPTRNDSNISTSAELLCAAPEISAVGRLSHIHIYYTLLQFSVGKIAIRNVALHPM